MRKFLEPIMGVSRATAAENRSRVVEVASRLFREKGFDGIGVSDLMKAAGLTHGGFYANFTSKEDLAVKACTLALAKDVELLAGIAAKASEAPLEAVVAFYLSERHRDHTGLGCPLAALGADAARYSAALREVFSAGLDAHVDLFEPFMPGSPRERRAKATTVVATLMGALVLARSIDDPVKSKAVLDDAAATVIAWRRAPLDLEVHPA